MPSPQTIPAWTRTRKRKRTRTRATCNKVTYESQQTQVGAGGGETVILNPRELRKAITLQQTTEDLKIWMTSAQTGFPLERDTDEVINSKDVTIKRVWQVEGLHGLPAIATTTFFPKVSKNKDIWWETKTSLNTP
jgi:hypothetical protein